MSSLRRINSSRANGALSRGPITPSGKQRSAANSLRHGLLAKNVVLGNESIAGFKELLDGHIAALRPANEAELGAIEEMSAASWRQRRAWAIETRIFDSAVAAQPVTPENDEIGRLTAGFVALSHRPEFELVQRYQTRLNRDQQRALNTFLILRMAAPEPDPDPDPPDPPAIGAKLPNEPNPISGHLETGDDMPRVA